MRALFALAAASVLAFAACSSSSSGDAATGGDAGPSDAAAEASALACDTTCKTLTVSANFNGNALAFDRGQFGTQTVDGGTGYHVEVHAGGDPACPTQNSPTPERSFVVTSIPHLAAGQSATEADGVRAAYLDFAGDGSAPLVKSTQIKVTVTAIDSAAKPTWIAFDVDAKFPTGSVTGHVYATYCESLSI